jgi:anti-sigma regulatory factor (Ser/Thr protein kinase)
MTSTLETTKSTLWPQAAVPRVRGTAWQWQITTLRELSGVRADVRDLLRSAGCDDAGDDPVSERILLALDELASNGLRHGAEPVRARLVATPGNWLIDISDAAAHQAPAPAVGRDAALGGLGLYLVAELTDRRGWAVIGGRKHVWASVPAQVGDRSHRASEDRRAVDRPASDPAPGPVPSWTGRWATLTRTLFSQQRALANARWAVERDRRAAAQREEADRALSGAPAPDARPPTLVPRGLVKRSSARYVP